MPKVDLRLLIKSCPVDFSLRFPLGNHVFLQEPVTNLLRNGDLLIKVGGEGLLRAPRGLWEGGVAVGRVDSTETGRVPTISGSVISINRFEKKLTKKNKIQ